LNRAVRAVVFDFDGLILDTETSIYNAWAEAYRAHGLEPIDLETWCAEIGTHNRLDLVGPLRVAAPDLDIEAFDAARRARRDELLSVEELLPGVEQWLEDAAAAGLAVAIASSSPPEWVEPHLQRFDLIDRFACISCFREPLRPKPEPDLYIAACDSLGVAPSEAIAVEDSPNGVAAAKAAGMFSVAVPRGMTAALDCSGADVVTSSLADLPLAEAISRCSGTPT
jgi:HAD superfamily hydrolase (TIGR01509 family)